MSKQPQTLRVRVNRDMNQIPFGSVLELSTKAGQALIKQRIAYLVTEPVSPWCPTDVVITAEDLPTCGIPEALLRKAGK